MTRDMEFRLLSLALLAVAICASLVLRGMVQSVEGPSGAKVLPTIVTVLGEKPRTGEAARIYRQMVEEQNFYAAFALNPEGGFGWSDNYATQAGADAAAMAWCREEGADCAIILQIAPEQPAYLEGHSLSKTAVLAAGEYGSHPASKALALSDLGDWGMAWGRHSRTEAAAAALAMCKARLDADVPGGVASGTCRVILSR